MAIIETKPPKGRPPAWAGDIVGISQEGSSGRMVIACKRALFTLFNGKLRMIPWDVDDDE